ncbi:MAG: hypothetical protein ACSHX9_06405 [Luteolibacter sp.]
MLKYTHRPGGTANCPECREPISKEANICPHCRSDLKENAAWQQAQQSGGCAMLLLISAISTISLGVISYSLLT